MPLPEFRQWQVYHSMFPIGPKRDDWRIAQLAALYVNAHRGKGAAPAPVSDFMWQPPRDEPDADDEAEQLRIFLGTLPAPKVLN